MRAFLLHPDDQVASVLAAARGGDTIDVHCVQTGSAYSVTAREAIPFGHKVAVRDGTLGQAVCKYGQKIGWLTTDVARGAHVHTHNLKSFVGREAAPMRTGEVRYRHSDLVHFAREVGERMGLPPQAAEDMATVMVEADLRGVATHGLRRLPPYVDRLRSKAVDPAAVPEALSRPPVVLIDGKNAVGHHVACTAVRSVVELAEVRGVALGVAKNSNHFGFAGYYASAIAQHGMIGIALSNGTPCIAAPGGGRPILSNNPLAISAPLGDASFVECDLATSVTSRDHVRQAMEEGRPIPPGWARDAAGRPTTDAAEALKGSMLPLGGERGFALIFALELLTGILPGGAFGDQVASKDVGDRPEGTSHFFLAVAIESVMRPESFRARLEALVDQLKGEGIADPAGTTRFPGARRWRLRAERILTGVPLSVKTVEMLRTLSTDLGIAFPQPREESA